MGLRHHFTRAAGAQRPIFLTASADANNVNLFTLAGSPGSAVYCVYTILPGVWIGSTASGTPALNIPAFPAGSRVVVQNQGTIAGCGGAGNNGTGGDAISLGNNVEIDNSTGTIGGGGGGGGRGSTESSGLAAADGGGGGGGQGSTGGAAGTKITSGGAVGADGTAGSRTTWGHGGAGGVNPTYGTSGGTGGRGGALGASGIPATTTVPSHTPGQAGGAAGFAVRLNGKTVTWTGGNNASQVLGSVA